VHLRAALQDPMVRHHDERVRVLNDMAASKILPKSHFSEMDAYAEHFTPGNNYLHDTLREILRSVIPSDDKYDLTFDLFEYALGMVYLDMNPTRTWSPPGAFGWRSGSWPAIDELNSELGHADESSPMLAAGLFGRDPKRLQSALERQQAFAQTWIRECQR